MFDKALHNYQDRFKNTIWQLFKQSKKIEFQQNSTTYPEPGLRVAPLWRLCLACVATRCLRCCRSPRTGSAKCPRSTAASPPTPSKPRGPCDVIFLKIFFFLVSIVFHVKLMKQNVHFN